MRYFWLAFVIITQSSTASVTLDDRARAAIVAVQIFTESYVRLAHVQSPAKLRYLEAHRLGHYLSALPALSAGLNFIKFGLGPSPVQNAFEGIRADLRLLPARMPRSSAESVSILKALSAEITKSLSKHHIDAFAALLPVWPITDEASFYTELNAYVHALLPMLTAPPADVHLLTSVGSVAADAFYLIVPSSHASYRWALTKDAQLLLDQRRRSWLRTNLERIRSALEPGADYVRPMLRRLRELDADLKNPAPDSLDRVLKKIKASQCEAFMINAG